MGLRDFQSNYIIKYCNNYSDRERLRVGERENRIYYITISHIEPYLITYIEENGRKRGLIFNE